MVKIPLYPPLAAPGVSKASHRSLKVFRLQRGHVGERETPSYHWSCHEVTHQSGLILLAPTDLSCGLSPPPLLSS